MSRTPVSQTESVAPHAGAADAPQLSSQELASQELSSQQLSSQQLFRGGNTVRIEHAGQTYWLRLTRGNKLILTK